MFEYMNWWFPDGETHFPEMLDKGITKGGPKGEYQWQARNKSLKYVKNKRLALDIGANVGLWSRSLTKHFDQVIAFEPVSIFRDCLNKNVKSTNFKVMSVALGNKETTANMNITEGNTGHTHIDPASIGTGNIQVITLDSLNLNNVDYIKLDCEGFEFRVIQGAEQTIKRCQPVIVVEQKPHDAYSDQYTQHAAVELLQSWGLEKLDNHNDDWILGFK